MKPKITEHFIVYDIETTGLNPERDSITQISALRVVDGKPINDLFNVFVNIGVPVPPHITKLTGITDRLLQSQGIPLYEAMSKLRSYCGADTMVAHNGIPFDSKFLTQAGRKAGICIGNKQFDSLIWARKLLPNEPHSLNALVKRFGIRQRDSHRAQNDVLMLVDVIECLRMEQQRQSALLQTSLFIP